MDTEDRAGSGMNDSGTGQEIGTPLTQLRSPGVHGWTYFIQRADGAIKIGFSIRPGRRIRGLAREFGALETLAVVPACLVGEYETHQLFAHLRLEGEWFRGEPDLLYFIEQTKVEVAAQPVPETAPPPAKAQNASLSQHQAVRRLINARAREYGANTRKGHAASNLVEQLKHLDKATGAQRANLLRSIPYQMARLAG